jgi:hypothetical protein
MGLGAKGACGLVALEWTQKKLTRPDGEIRAGRVDRRRGSGGRERRSGLKLVLIYRPYWPV